MPSYQVINKGFFAGRVYSPTGKRKVLHTEKPFPNVPGSKKENVPSWLKALKPETAAQASARKGAETKAANLAKKKAEDDAKDISEASFLGEGETGSAVENL